MPEVLDLEDVQMSEAGERRSPDPDEAHLKLYHGTYEAPTSIEIHRVDLRMSATPEQMVIGNLNHPRLRLRHPIAVMITREESLVIANLPEIEEFGYGPHVTAAVEDLRQTLIELYQTLKTEYARLGPDMVQLWNELQTLIEER